MRCVIWNNIQTTPCSHIPFFFFFFLPHGADQQSPMGMTLSRVNGNLTIHKKKVPMDYGWSGSLAENGSLARVGGISIVNPGPICFFTISRGASSSIIWPSVIRRLICLSLSHSRSQSLSLTPTVCPNGDGQEGKRKERKTKTALRGLVAITTVVDERTRWTP